jgi:HEAT repeat protein
MSADENALKIFNSIVHGREVERNAASAALDDRAHPLDRGFLRELIRRALKDTYYPGREDWEQDDSLRWTRSWLVNTLGRICDDDAAAAAAVRKYLDPTFEPKYWVRFWAFESLLATGPPDLLDIAKALAKDQEPLLRMVGLCVIATRCDGRQRDEALRKIEEGLDGDDYNLQWASLRALRHVHIPQMFDRLYAILAEDRNDDITYDAIVSLSSATPGSPHAELAASKLNDFITRCRRRPWFDGMRTAALKALGRLKKESFATLLVEELADDNPAVAREAALALKEVVGIRTAAARVVEAASKAGPERAEALARALRWMERDAVVEELESVMVSGRPEHQEAARLLLSEVGGLAAMQKLRARTSAVAQYSAEMEKAEEKIRNLFETTIAEARAGFKLASMMDVAVFVIGLGLVGVSAGIILARGGDLNSWAGVGLTGGTGVLGVVYGILIARPRKQILEAVDHLMHLKVVFLAYLRQLHQVDQAYTRRLLEDKPLGSEEAAQYSRMADATMRAAVEQMLVVRERPRRGRAAAGRHETELRADAEAAAGNGKVGKVEGASVH